MLSEAQFEQLRALNVLKFHLTSARETLKFNWCIQLVNVKG